MSENKAIINADNTDSNGNVGVSVRITNGNAETLENINITNDDTFNNWSQYNLTDNPAGTSGSLTVYRSGKTCILKGIGLDGVSTGHQVEDGTDSRNGWRECGFNSLPEEYRPPTNQFWYNEIVLLQSLTFRMKKAVLNSNGTPTGAYTDLDQVLNNPFHVSFALSTLGTLSARVERKNIGWNDTVSGVNFTLLYLLK